jgi:hypothetical protein
LGGLAFGEATGLAAPGLPLGFGDDWAKPAMAKLNPNISVIAVFFMLSVRIDNSPPPHSQGTAVPRQSSPVQFLVNPL